MKYLDTGRSRRITIPYILVSQVTTDRNVKYMICSYSNGKLRLNFTQHTPTDRDKRLVLFSTPSTPTPGRREKSDWSVNLTTHFHLVPKLRIMELYLHSSIHFHGLLFN
jgi:hypothetical protein